jgi:hypothetical protein
MRALPSGAARQRSRLAIGGCWSEKGSSGSRSSPLARKRPTVQVRLQASLQPLGRVPELLVSP